jgi:hypothetical protein
VTKTEELQSLQKNALACLGRNVLHFQRLEFRLRLLLTISDYEGPPRKFAEFLRARAGELRKSSLGSLAAEWNVNFPQSGKPSKTKKPLPNSHIALRFRAETSPEHARTMKRELRSLVAERNRLIHHDLATFDPNSAENCRKLIILLDQQNRRIISQIKMLEQMQSAAVAGFQALFDSFG